MKVALLVLGSLLVLSFAVPTGAAVPPVCLEKGAGALGTGVEVQITCGPSVTVVHCPPVGTGSCRAVTAEL